MVKIYRSNEPVQKILEEKKVSQLERQKRNCRFARRLKSKSQQKESVDKSTGEITDVEEYF